jgi:hypothetical protein
MALGAQMGRRGARNRSVLRSEAAPDGAAGVCGCCAETRELLGHVPAPPVTTHARAARSSCKRGPWSVAKTRRKGSSSSGSATRIACIVTVPRAPDKDYKTWRLISSSVRFIRAACPTLQPSQSFHQHHSGRSHDRCGATRPHTSAGASALQSTLSGVMQAAMAALFQLRFTQRSLSNPKLQSTDDARLLLAACSMAG